MSIDHLLNRPCTLILRTLDGSTTDDYGNAIDPDPAQIDTVCELQKNARRAEEPELQGELSDTVWTLILPRGTAIDTGDAVRVEPEGVFELVGAPWHVRNPWTGAESHVECTVRRTAGAESGS